MSETKKKAGEKAEKKKEKKVEIAGLVEDLQVMLKSLFLIHDHTAQVELHMVAYSRIAYLRIEHEHSSQSILSKDQLIHQMIQE
mgnify:CR=1 FL=1